MEESIEQLYLLYYHELYGFLIKQCPDLEPVDDIIQNTFLEAFKSLENFKGAASMKTWLFSIAKHQLYRHLRKHGSPGHKQELSQSELSIQPDFSDNVLAGQILEAINGMQPPHHEIMLLRLIHGLSFKEIGLRTLQTENYCRVNFYRMKERLRKEYGDE